MYDIINKISGSKQFYLNESALPTDEKMIFEINTKMWGESDR